MSGMLSIPMYLATARDESARVGKFAAADLVTKSDIAYLKKVAPKLTTPDALLKDYRALKVVLGAYGMSDRLNQTALVKKLLTQDPQATRSLARGLANQAAFRFATALGNWTSAASSPLSNIATLNQIANSYAQTNFEANQGKQVPGMQQALYFRRTIANATTVPQVISDSTLIEVVSGALNLPDQFGTLDYDRQVAELTKQLKFDKFKDPTYVDKFVQRYLAAKSAATATADPMVGLIAGTTTGVAATPNDMLNTLGQNNGTASGTGSILSLFA